MITRLNIIKSNLNLLKSALKKNCGGPKLPQNISFIYRSHYNQKIFGTNPLIRSNNLIYNYDSIKATKVPYSNKISEDENEDFGEEKDK